jgi:hypothetical protein
LIPMQHNRDVKTIIQGQIRKSKTLKVISFWFLGAISRYPLYLFIFWKKKNKKDAASIGARNTFNFFNGKW